MPDFYFRLNLGDLVDFKASRVTEEYIDETRLVGIIIEQRYVFTADNKYKVRTNNQDYWVGEDKLTLLSSAVKIKT